MDYHIRGSIEHLGQEGYSATVIATPIANGATSHRASERFRTRAQAATRLRELVVMMGKTIRTEGGTVLEVRTEE